VKRLKRAFQLVLLSSGALAVFPVSCHSIFAKSTRTSDDGYEEVTPLGSLVPQRVKKGETAVATSATSTMSPEEFDKMRQRMQAVGKLSAGP